MKRILLATITFSALLFSACGGAGTNTGNSNASASNGATAKAPEKTPEKPAVTMKPGEVPFDGMSNVATTAKAGEHVLCLDARAATEIASEPIAEASGIFSNRKISAPGDIESEIEEYGKTYKVPNAYIIALPKGQKAKVGDIVLTWWQSGGGMFRGIVTEAANPAEPTVRYLNMRPASDKFDKLKPDTFIVLKDLWQPGNAVAFKNEKGEMISATLIRVNGDKVLLWGFAQKLLSVNKSDVTPLPIQANFKIGDKVMAAPVSQFNECTIISIDAAAGKITVKPTTGSAEEKMVDFGLVMKG